MILELCLAASTVVGLTACHRWSVWHTRAKEAGRMYTDLAMHVERHRRIRSAAVSKGNRTRGQRNRDKVRAKTAELAAIVEARA